MREFKYFVKGDKSCIYTDRTLGQRILDSCNRFKTRIAISDGHSNITYEDLKKQISAVINYLKEKDINKQDIVAVLVSNDISSIVKILAVTIMGGIYVPVDKNYPSERKNYMIDYSNAKYLLDDYQTLSPEDNLINIANDSINGIIYIIFTSGSTGYPKGVMISEKGIINLCDWYIKCFHIKADSIIFSLNSLSFDASVKNIFAPLLCGAKIIVNGESIIDPEKIVQKIYDEKVSHINGTPSILQEILKHGEIDGYKKLESIQYIISGGETFQKKSMSNLWKLRNGKINIANVYGPTEAASLTSAYFLGNEDFITDQNIIPVGKIIDNKKICIVDQDGIVDKCNKIGEILIGGVGIAKGYLNNKALTEEKFVTLCGEKFYKSGDFGYFDINNILYYCGRKDNQIKRNGYRIELDEISKSVERIQGVDKCITLLYKDNIVCCYCGKVNIKIKQRLYDFLPRFMIPDRIIHINHVPLTTNGKLNIDILKKIIETHDKYLDVECLNSTQQKIKKIWQNVLNTSSFTLNDNFFDVGGNSLRLFQMVRYIEKEFNQKLDPLDVMEMANINEISKMVNKKTNK